MIVMVVIIFFAVDNYEEILFILRYVDRVKRIVNYVVVNEDFNVRIIRDFRDEVDMLKQQFNEVQVKKIVYLIKFRYKIVYLIKFGIKQVFIINLRFEIKYFYSYLEIVRGNIYIVKQVNRNNISLSMNLLKMREKMRVFLLKDLKYGLCF